MFNKIFNLLASACAEVAFLLACASPFIRLAFADRQVADESELAFGS